MTAPNPKPDGTNKQLAGVIRGLFRAQNALATAMAEQGNVHLAVYRRALERVVDANYVGIEILALRESEDPLDNAAADLIESIKAGQHA